jgi:hypothetical protein
MDIIASCARSIPRTTWRTRRPWFFLARKTHRIRWKNTPKHRSTRRNNLRIKADKRKYIISPLLAVHLLRLRSAVRELSTFLKVSKAKLVTECYVDNQSRKLYTFLCSKTVHSYFTSQQIVFLHSKLAFLLRMFRSFIKNLRSFLFATIRSREQHT